MSLFGLSVGILEKKTVQTGVWTSFSWYGLLFGCGVVGDAGDSGRSSFCGQRIFRAGPGAADSDREQARVARG